MNTNDIIGFAGVLMILVAYFLNLSNIISKKSFSYLLLNIFGAGLATYASLLINYVPFIILESIWTLVSLIALINLLKMKKLSIR